MSSEKAVVAVPRPQTGEVVRTGFGDTEIEVSPETTGGAMAAQAKASIEAAYIMALRRPRDIDQVRVKLLKTCQRPRFAEAARWVRPVGREKNEKTGRWEQKIGKGLSIRFAEEAARNMGNLDIDSYCIYDDPRKKIVKFVVVDLETNTKWSKTKTIEKTTEKKKLWENEEAIAQRITSNGEVVFIVEATPEEVAKREGAEASKAWRDAILKNLPADIKEECLERIEATIANRAAEDPEGEKKRILDSFASIGIEPVHLKEYLGHDLATVSPAELVSLRGIYVSIKEGTTNWGDVMATKQEADEANGNSAKPPAQPGQKGAAAAPATGAPAAQPAPASSSKPGQRNLADVASQSRVKREAKAGEGPIGPIDLPEGAPTREPGADDDK